MICVLEKEARNLVSGLFTSPAFTHSVRHILFVCALVVCP
jgi:hypothetical protein